jgi:riboflavin kinase/FMN adenylyltransferase
VHPAETLSLPGSVITAGAFDEVHRGHQALIRKVVERAAELGAPSVAYTFDPPPRAYFQDAPVLTPLPEKVHRLESLGLDHAVVAVFDDAYAARSAQDFLEELADLNPVEVWAGPDFRFGHVEEGDVDTLGARFTTRVIEPLRCWEGKVISSSRARALLAQDDVDKARHLLGWNV